MDIDTVPNRTSPPAILLRESWREGRKTYKRTLANLSHWPAHKVEGLRRVLRDEPLVAPEAMLTIERSVPHGHVEAILQMIRRLELDTLIASKRSRERDLVSALLVERLIQPRSKLAATRLWNATTLGETLGVQDTDVDEVSRPSIGWGRATRRSNRNSPRGICKMMATPRRDHVAGLSGRTPHRLFQSAARGRTASEAGRTARRDRARADEDCPGSGAPSRRWPTRREGSTWVG
jgi:hypothetical protein